MASLCSQAELLKFYDREDSLEGPDRMKLSAWVHGNHRPMTIATAGAAAAMSRIPSRESVLPPLTAGAVVVVAAGDSFGSSS